jgi:hypothetical protein
MNEEKFPKGLSLRLDSSSESSNPALPAFIARPAGAPLYHGFAILDATVDGWKIGAISGYSPEELV